MGAPVFITGDSDFEDLEFSPWKLYFKNTLQVTLKQVICGPHVEKHLKRVQVN